MNIKNLIVINALVLVNPVLGMWAGKALTQTSAYQEWSRGQLAQGESIRQQRADATDNISDPEMHPQPEEPASESCWNKCWNSCNHCWSRCVSIFCCARNRDRRPSEETLMSSQTD